MRFVRRSVAVLIGCATWCIAASSVAYARIVDDVGPVGIPAGTSPGPAEDTLAAPCLCGSRGSRGSPSRCHRRPGPLAQPLTELGAAAEVSATTGSLTSL